MTAIVMLICGGLFTLIAAMLRFEPNARILTQYSDDAVAPTNCRASKYFFWMAVLSFSGGAASLAFPEIAHWSFAVWLVIVVVVAIFVASTS